MIISRMHDKRSTANSDQPMIVAGTLVVRRPLRGRPPHIGAPGRQQIPGGALNLSEHEDPVRHVPHQMRHWQATPATRRPRREHRNSAVAESPGRTSARLRTAERIDRMHRHQGRAGQRLKRAHAWRRKGQHLAQDMPPDRRKSNRIRDVPGGMAPRRHEATSVPCLTLAAGFP